jgi:hypothetical protein
MHEEAQNIHVIAHVLSKLPNIIKSIDPLT